MFGAIKKWIIGETGWLALLAVAAIAAGVYVHVRRLTNDRDQLLAWAQLACADGGQGFDESTVDTTTDKGRKVRATYGRGKLCRIHIADLARFQADTVAATAKALADERVEREKKSNDDGAAATRNDVAQRAAARKMETANAQVQPDDRVGDDWFDALGDLAGVQPRRD